MPGAYTHLAMVQLAAARSKLEAIEAFPPEVIYILGRRRQYCLLGAVSPDYPYLDILSDKSKQWADVMHHGGCDAFIRRGLSGLKRLSGGEREKVLAWLFGYTAHTVMDVTIHPVINCRVGEYVQNKREHRVCEMNQDVHIFQRLNLQIKLSEFLDSTIGHCADINGHLDSAISGFWAELLTRTYPTQAKSNAPEPGAWHSWFKTTVDKIAEEGDWLSAISRHVSRDIGLSYPHPNELDYTYIENLPTPDGGTMHFDALFDMAMNNVHEIWAGMARALEGSDGGELALPSDWNLDSGMSGGQLVFWKS